MAETKPRKVDAEKENIGRVWGSGAWGDILPTVSHFLPPRERFTVQRVSTLFQLASERSRLAVSGLVLSAVPGEPDEVGLEFTAKIGQPKASSGLIMLKLPQLTQLFDCNCGCAILEDGKKPKVRRKCEKKLRKKYDEVLAKLSLPNLTQIDLCTGPSLESVLPFLRRHQGISSLKMEVSGENCWGANGPPGLSSQLKSICEALSGARIKRLQIREILCPLDLAKEFEGTNLFTHVEQLDLTGNFVESKGQFLPKFHPFLTVLSVRSFNGCELTALLLREVPTIRHLSLTTIGCVGHGDLLIGNLRKMSLESLNLCIVGYSAGSEHLNSFIEALASSGEPSNLRTSLKELTIRLENYSYRFDFGVFNTTAFLHFPGLNSLRLKIEQKLKNGIFPTTECHNIVSYEQLPVFAELNQRLRVLEIPMLLPDVVGSSFTDRCKALFILGLYSKKLAASASF